jgi:hypothetical protein
MKMTVFWDVSPCSLVEVYRRFRGAYCLHHQGAHHHRLDDGVSQDGDLGQAVVNTGMDIRVQ